MTATEGTTSEGTPSNSGQGAAHPCSSGLTTKKELQTALIQQGSTIGRYCDALRYAIHQLVTRNGNWCTDNPEFWTGEEIVIEGTTYHAATGMTLRASEDTYWRDDTTDAASACRRCWMMGNSLLWQRARPLHLAHGTMIGEHQAKVFHRDVALVRVSLEQKVDRFH